MNQAERAGPKQGVLGELCDGEALHWWGWGVSP